MAKYRVKERSYINGVLCEPGKEVELQLPEGQEPDHLEPIKEPKPARGAPVKTAPNTRSR